MLLWLWCRPAAVAPRRALAWEPPYASGVALEKAKRQKVNILINKKFSTPSPALVIFLSFFFIFYFILFFCLFRAKPVAYGGSQARGLIGATAAGLHHSHSNARFESCLRPTPQLLAMKDP